MITIALDKKTVEISGFNTAEKDGMHQLWATIKSSGKSFLVTESADEEEIKFIQDFINTAIDEGELLADLTKKVK